MSRETQKHLDIEREKRRQACRRSEGVKMCFSPMLSRHVLSIRGLGERVTPIFNYAKRDKRNSPICTARIMTQTALVFQSVVLCLLIWIEYSANENSMLFYGIRYFEILSSKAFKFFNFLKKTQMI